MKTNFFYGCTSADEVQVRFDELTKIYADQDEVLKVIRYEYAPLINVLKSAEKEEPVKEKATISEIIKVLQEKVGVDGLHLEICGTWLWLTGKTYPVKEALKELGFRYSSNKLCWYYRQDENRSSNQKPVPFEIIKEKYGSKEISLV
jgi:hypothetical protein